MTDNVVEQTENSPEGAPEKLPLLARLEKYGRPGAKEKWESGREDYVAKLGLTADDVPELLAIVRRWADPQGDWTADEANIAGYAPVHAWRCLAQLRAVEAIPVLLGMLDPLDELFDDLSLEEFPHVFVYIGLAALTPLCEFLADGTHRTFSRIAVSHGLRDLARKHLQVRDEVVKALTDALSRFAESDDALNGSLVADLMELRAAESAEVIEQAFAADRVDAMCCGNWDKVRKTLGVEGLGLVSEEQANQRPFARLSPSLDAMGQQLREQMQAQMHAHEQAQAGTDNRAIANTPTVPAGTYAPDRTVTAPIRTDAKIGRNDPCSCGSGKKYKKCCAK